MEGSSVKSQAAFPSPLDKGFTSREPCRRHIVKTTYTYLFRTLPCLAMFLMAAVTVCPSPARCAPPQAVGLLAGAGGLGDQSYNDMTMAGLGRAGQLFDFRLLVEETGTSRESQIQGLERLLAQGSEVVVANGAGLGNLVVEYGPRHPDVLFVVNDYWVDNISNVASTVFAQEEGSFLVGMLAAAVAPNRRLGFIGGVDMDVIHEFLHGFAKGAGYVAADIRLTAAFVSAAGDYSGFSKPIRGQEIATEMFRSGVDIIFAVAGLTGNGVIEAAREQGKLAIGVDADQDHMARGHVLSSMMKRLDQSTYKEIVKIANGRFSPGVTHYGLANGGVSLSPMRFTRHLVSDETMNRIRDAQRDIVSGSLPLSTLPIPQYTILGGNKDTP